MLKRAKAEGCITAVNTVCDFISDKENPNRRWPLGKEGETCRHVDLLIVDCEEALRLNGSQDMPSAIAFSREK